MALNVTFQNPKTAEIKVVKVGWSWTLFLFASFFGLPLFLRRLTNLGRVFLAVSIMGFVLPASASDEDARFAIQFFMSVVMTGLNIWMAIKGNQMTARNYIELGWTLLHPESPEAAIARKTWALPEPTETKSNLVNN